MVHVAGADLPGAPPEDGRETLALPHLHRLYTLYFREDLASQFGPPLRLILLLLVVLLVLLLVILLFYPLFHASGVILVEILVIDPLYFGQWFGVVEDLGDYLVVLVVDVFDVY